MYFLTASFGTTQFAIAVVSSCSVRGLLQDLVSFRLRDFVFVSGFSLLSLAAPVLMVFHGVRTFVSTLILALMVRIVLH